MKKHINKSGNTRKNKVRREQPRKDSSSKRINLDNERVSKIEKTLEKSNTDNDISWYTRNPELLKAAASFYNFVPAGQIPASDYEKPLPGVLGLYCLPSFTPMVTEAINIAGDAQYSFVVHANSRNTSYEAVDLMQIEIAAASLFSLYAAGVRVYGLSRGYNGANKYQFEALIRAAGFDPDDIRNNLSLIWYDLNNFAAQLHQIWVPNTMSVIDRWFWLNTNVYMDSESRKGQFYVLGMKQYLAYDPKASSSGGALKWVKTGGGMVTSGTDPNTESSFRLTNKNTWDQYKKTLQFLINQLMNVEDRGVIMGDILKAYGPDKIFAVNEIPVDYTVEPVYNKEVLTQIENATLYNGEFFQLNQSGGKLVPNYGQNCSATAVEYAYQIPKQMVVNFHQLEDPTPEQLVIATRLMSSGFNNLSLASNTYATLEPGATGTECVATMRVFHYNATGELTTTDLAQFSADPALAQVKLLSAFDWAPMMYSTSISGAPGKTNGVNLQKVTVKDVVGDVDNFTIMDMDAVKKIHRMCIFSEFDLPVQL